MRLHRAHRILVGYVATGIVVVVCLVAAPPLPLAALLGVGGCLLLAQGWLATDPPTPPTSRHPLEALVHEVERSRRYGRRCTLARVPGGAQAASGTRRTDETWDLGGDLMLLMPETTSAAAQRAVARLLGDETAQRMAVATFPDDALTVGGLLDAMRVPRAAPASVPELGPAPVGDAPDASDAPREVDLGVEVG